MLNYRINTKINSIFTEGLLEYQSFCVLFNKPTNSFVSTIYLSQFKLYISSVKVIGLKIKKIVVKALALNIICLNFRLCLLVYKQRLSLIQTFVNRPLVGSITGVEKKS